MEDLLQKFQAVKASIDELNEKKVRLEERHRTEREKLEALVKEITAKGYDPQKLSETLEEKKQELEKLLADLEASTKDASEKLQAIEG